MCVHLHMHVHILMIHTIHTYTHTNLHVYVYACRMPIIELICKCDYISCKIAFPLHNLNMPFKLYLNYDTML